MNRIAKNTVYLYGRQVLTALISLYTSRVVLQALGVADLGVYNVVGSVVTMFTFVSGAVSSATCRFLTFGLGKGESKWMSDIFECSLLMHLMIAIGLALILETVGVWLLNCSLNIPENRMPVANYVLQCVIISTLIGVVMIPFSAVFGAHEQMGFTSLISLVDAVTKLGVIIVVSYSSNDRLTLYATLLLILPVVESLIVVKTAKMRFREVSLRPRYIKSVFADMSRYAGWNLAGAVGVMGRNSGVNVVVNMTCGVVINASRGLACQVSAQVMSLAANLQTAFSPQITKRYAMHDEEGMVRLLMQCCKYSFFLICIFSIPLFLRGGYLMRLWLGQVPDYVLEFTLLIMIVETIYWVATPIGIAIGATGDNKWYQICMATIMLLDMPVSYLLLRTGIEPFYAVYGSIAIAAVAFMVGIALLKRKLAILNIKDIIIQIVRCLIAAFIAIVLCYFVHKALEDNLWGVVAISISSLFFTSLIFYLIAIDADERKSIKSVLTRK